MGRRPVALKRPLALLLTTAAVVLVIDQASKSYVRAVMRPDTSIRLIPNVLWLTYVRNQGAAFGLMSGQQVLFVATTVLVLGGIVFVWWRYRPRGVIAVLALGLLLGGALGNLIDRVALGRVTDFLDVHFWPVFNVADSAVLVGVAILVMWLLMHEDTEDEEADEREPGEPGARQV